MNNNEYAKLKNIALNYLSKYSCSKANLAKYLARKSSNVEQINNVINFCTEYNFIDDHAYGRAFIRNCLSKNYSRQKIIIKGLMEKGLEKDLLEELLTELLTSEQIIENIHTILQKRHTKTTQQNIRYLLSQGFNMADINKALAS
jgi:regulatory protein